MRLAQVDHGHGIGKRLMFAMMRIVTGARAPGVVRTHMYRPELFGKASGRLVQMLLRHSAKWTVAQSELFAAFVSAKNQCPF